MSIFSVILNISIIQDGHIYDVHSLLDDAAYLRGGQYTPKLGLARLWVNNLPSIKILITDNNPDRVIFYKTSEAE